MISNVRAKIREGKSLDEALDFMRESLVHFENERAVAAVKWIDENRKYFSELPYCKWGQNGQAFYEERTDILNHNPEKESRLLSEAGIAGIRYLDGNSRGSGKGSYNYVVFDDADVSIAERYYEPMNADVDSNQLVHVVDLTGVFSNKVRNYDELKKWIDSFNGSSFTTADNKAIVTLLHKNTKHLVESSRPFYREINTSVRDSFINNIVDLIKSVVLIESVPNNKIIPITNEMTRGQRKSA